MPCVDRVLIVGGGIAGLTAAIAISQKGIACEIVETTPSGEPVGAAITIIGPAVNALAAVGILEACQELGHVNPLTWGDYDAAGRHIGQTPSTPTKPPPAVGIYRPILADLLRQQALKSGVNLRHSTHVNALSQGDHSVSVEFSDASRGTYDLVIGADGIRSSVRRLVFGERIQPRYAGQTSIRWMAEGPPIEGPTMLYRARSAYLLAYSLPRQNLIYVATVSNRDPTEHVNDDRARSVLAEQLAEFSAPFVVELAKRLTAHSKVIVRPFEWLLVPDPWFCGRIVLIGDAAHATTAHLAAGGGMAMEDAVVLSECLSPGADVRTALEAFMRRRFERVRLVVDTSVAIIKLEKEGTSAADIEAFRLDTLRRLATPY